MVDFALSVPLHKTLFVFGLQLVVNNLEIYVEVPPMLQGLRELRVNDGIR